MFLEEPHSSHILTSEPAARQSAAGFFIAKFLARL
jgi:hypothetical protein